MKQSDMQVTLINSMGTDLDIVNAARVSFAKESKWEEYAIEGEEFCTRLKEQDIKLINYLAKHNHWTPFAHAFLSFRIKAPIFVARQLVKHQVGLAWNEVSRRYVDDEPEFWFPKEWRGRPINAKQGSSGTVKEVNGFCGERDLYSQQIVDICLSWYHQNIDNGMAPEQARMVLPQNTMTEWIWSGSLAAFSRVCKLRLDPHAQQETTEVAQKIAELAEPLFPVSWSALLNV